MQLSDEQIRSMVNDAFSELETMGIRAVTEVRMEGLRDDAWLCNDINEAVEIAKSAQQQLVAMSMTERNRMIAGIRAAAIEHAERLAEFAYNETGYGRVSDKILKNILAAEKTPGTEDLHAQAFSGDFGLTLVEGAPFGVIGSITPSHQPHGHYYQ